MERKLLHISLFLISGIILFAFTSKKQNTDISAFDVLKISGAYDVVLTQGNEYKLRMEGQEKDLERVEIRQSGSTLTLGAKEGHWKSSHKVTIYITFESMEKLHISGAGDVKTTTTFKGDKLALEVSGAGSIDMDLDVDELETEISGAADIKLRGKADRQDIEFSGVGSYTAYDVESKDVEVETSGAGSVKVYASNSLKVDASGVGSVKYRGNPANKDIETSGVGSVKSDN